MDELQEVVSRYVAQRNLDSLSYWEGLLCKGPLDDELIKTLIRYHKDWLGDKK